MGECLVECPKTDEKHQYVNPHRQELGLRGFWIKIEEGTTEKKELKFTQEDGVEQNISYFTIGTLNEYGKYGIYIFVYTTDGLYLLHMYDVNDLGVFLPMEFSPPMDVMEEQVERVPQYKSPINLEVNVDDEDDTYSYDYSVKYGHSSFFSKSEYDEQREIQKRLDELDEPSIPHDLKQLVSSTCKVLYAGELLYHKPSYLDHGVIVYWTNGSGHFKPNNEYCRAKINVYFPEDVYVHLDSYDRAAVSDDPDIITRNFMSFISGMEALIKYWKVRTGYNCCANPKSLKAKGLSMDTVFQKGGSQA